MSTEHQKYSTENQSEANHRYAEERGFQVVRTYSDAGRSGLKLRHREGLQQLIDDVISGKADFEIILVYDISRWGRFQDVDESAFLEHICTRAGITVHYCAEQFENNGSLSATIIKSIKRAMAAEYSRELSTKVFAGQCRLTVLGFHQGGTIGLGLRRQLVDQDRQVKFELRRGEYKNIQSDRIVLIPGPTEEIQTVRRIFELFVKDGLNEKEIADLLNQEGVPAHFGRPWQRGTIKQVLTDERYVGNNVWNRTSTQLGKKRIRHPSELFIRAEGVFTPIIERPLFEAARKRMEERARRPTDAELLEGLADLLRKKGRLSHVIIKAADGLPRGRVYAQRFGSLARAYQLIGYKPRHDLSYGDFRGPLNSRRVQIIEEVVAEIQRRGAAVARDPTTDLLRINEEFSALITVIWCAVRLKGAPRWAIRLNRRTRPDFTIGVRMAAGNHDILDYYVVPRLDFSVVGEPVYERNGADVDAYRFDTLVPFIEMTARSHVVGRFA